MMAQISFTRLNPWGHALAATRICCPQHPKLLTKPIAPWSGSASGSVTTLSVTGRLKGDLLLQAAST